MDKFASLRIDAPPRWVPNLDFLPRDRMVETSFGMLLAHPLTEPFQLPVSPLVSATAAACLVLLVAFTVSEGKPRFLEQPDLHVVSWAGSLSVPQRATRLAAVALLVLAIAAGRLGVDDELENLAPALVVGALWPLLVFASISLGPVWRWIDPWDGIARALTRDQPAQAPRHVWPAAVIAVGWVWYVSAYSDPLDPRSVGAILAAYTLLTVGGCLALGRVRWLSTSEPFGVVLSWMALLPRRRLTDWSPPRGAEALLGVFAGGVLFGAVRRSELWGGLNTAEEADLYAGLGVVLFCAAAAGLLLLMALSARQLGDRAVAARAAVPAVAGIIVAVALDRNRLSTSVQLLPELLGDPFGRGWDLFGRAGSRLDPAPLGTTGLLTAQLAFVVAGHVAGAAVLARRLERGARGPAALLLAILASAAVIALVSH
jgi:hypothetical protein